MKWREIVFQLSSYVPLSISRLVLAANISYSIFRWFSLLTDSIVVVVIVQHDAATHLRGPFFNVSDCSSDFQAKQAAKSIKNGSLFDPFIIQTDTFQTCTNSSQCIKNAEYSANWTFFVGVQSRSAMGQKLTRSFFCIMLPSQKCSSGNFHVALFLSIMAHCEDTYWTSAQGTI